MTSAKRLAVEQAALQQSRCEECVLVGTQTLDLDFANIPSTGKLLLHIRLVTLLVGQKLRVIDVLYSLVKAFIGIFVDRFVRRKTVHMVGAWQE